MSQGNAEVVRSVIQAWNRRDLEGMLALAATDVVFVNSPAAVEPGTRHGRDEYAAVMRAQWEIIGDSQLEIVSMQAAGDDVFALLELSRSLGGSDMRLTQRIGTCMTIREGRMARQAMLPLEDFERALAAAGLGP